MGKPLFSFVLFLIAVASSSVAKAGFIFSGNGAGPSGGTVSASVDFSISGSNLDIVLTNNTVGGTTQRGNLLTGLIFDIADPGVSLGNLSSLSLNGTGLLFTNKTTGSSVGALSGSWTSHMAGPPDGRYGVATSGLDGLFSVGTITRGTGGDDYAIAAAGTFPAPPGSGTSNSFNHSAFPLVQDALHFVMPITHGILDDFDFTNVKFAFGTDGYTIPGTNTPVPEPGSLAVWGGLIVVGAVMYRRHEAKRA